MSRSRSSAMCIGSSDSPGSIAESARLQLRLAGDLGRLLHEAPAAAQPIDRAVARGGRDPGPGVRGDAALRPRLQGGDERLLDGLLGEVEVAEDPDQGRDRSPLLLAEQAIDDLVGGGQFDRSPPPAGSVAPALSRASKSTIGRTSTEPSSRRGSSRRTRGPRPGRPHRPRRSRRGSPWFRRTAHRS